MKKLALSALILSALASQAFANGEGIKKYYLSGIVTCDTQVVTTPNIGYCRSISGGSPGGILYAIDVTKKDRPVVKTDFNFPVSPIAHMKILEISDRARKNGWPECTDLLVEDGVITWTFDHTLDFCLKEGKPTPAE